MTFIIIIFLMIVLCIVFIITSAKDGRFEELGAPIGIIIVMVLVIIIYVRNPQSLTRESNDEPVLGVMQESESKDKTSVRFTEEVYRTDKGSRVYILTDTETGCQYIWHRNGITKLENTEVE